MRREREAGSSKLQTEGAQGQGFFSWIGCVIFDDADECISMGKCEEESHNPKKRRTGKGCF